MIVIEVIFLLLKIVVLIYIHHGTRNFQPQNGLDRKVVFNSSFAVKNDLKIQKGPKFDVRVNPKLLKKKNMIHSEIYLIDQIMQGGVNNEKDQKQVIERNQEIQNEKKLDEDLKFYVKYLKKT